MLNPNISSDFSTHLLSYLEKSFLERLEAELHLNRFTKKKVLPKNSGQTVRWHRSTNYSSDVTALTEGVTPDGQTYASASVLATIYGYGNFVTISDFFQMTAINDTLLENKDLLAYQAALSLDTLIRTEARANGTAVYADRTNNSSIANVESGSDKISSAELKKLARDFHAANVPGFDNGQYVGIIHPFAEYDLLVETAASDFIILAANNGTGADVIKKGIIGSAFGFDLYRSTNISADGTSTNTYGHLFLGRDGIASVDLQSAGLEMIVKGPGSAGTEDPLNQRATVAYKMYYGVAVLEAARVRNFWAYSV